MRLLVVGASGLVGAELLRAAPPGWSSLGVARHPGPGVSSLVDLAAPESILRDFRPDAVAVASAWPHVDGCQADPARSHRENVGTVQALVDALGPGSPTRILFFSTEHVFDGTRPAHGEADPPHPLNVYSAHKAEVEALLLARGRALVARTSYVFGLEARRKNFLYRVVDAARAGTPLAVPVAQGGMPTWSRWLARSALTLLDQGLDGVVHLTGPEVLTKAAWAARLAAGLGLPPLTVKELPWAECGQVAPRPASVRLASTRHALTHPPLDEVLAGLAKEIS